MRTRTAAVRGQRGQRGMTLIELLVVLAIVGILMVAAVALMKSDPTPRDVALQIANQIREASRKSIAGGSVRADVVLGLGVDARTRIRVFQDAAGNQLVVVERLEEADPGAAAWVEISRLFINRAITVVGYSPTADLASGSTPDEILGAGELDLGHGIGNEGIWCFNEGRCEAVTLFLEGKDSSRARVVVMPLLATPLTFDGW